MPRLPAEWEPQRALLLTWPHAATDWAARLPALQSFYTDLTALVCQYQPVLALCADTALATEVAVALRAAGVPETRRILAVVPNNDTWIRDYGPLTVIDDAGRPSLIDYRFNAWGGKFQATLDDQACAALHHTGVFGATPLRRRELVLEGGAIDSDGTDSLLLVERTLIDPARNPGWDRAAVERELHATLGAQRCLWLKHGWLEGDDTDGHIDMLARFCAPDTICHAWSEHVEDSDRPELTRMHEELHAVRRATGEPYRLIPLPQPAPRHAADGRRLAASYVNFVLVNGAVLVPIYADPADRLALARLGQAFPGRAVHGIDCRELIDQGGSLHCSTMQLPAAVPLAGVAV